SGRADRTRHDANRWTLIRVSLSAPRDGRGAQGRQRARGIVPASLGRQVGSIQVSRFFKSAAFPILVVIVLAFFAERMISSSSGSKTTHTWSEFMQYADQGKVTYVKTNTGENSLKYSIEPDKSHTITIGIPSDD